ncbi:helix-turn-helix domain-containing protein, partial [Nitrospiraceae bacterium AH_259_D15_M11_P09]|nr:helix-turn-helix domain-containing protein [Nitrospiraceae bacterium AH_259_D15_M11_P09]
MTEIIKSPSDVLTIDETCTLLRIPEQALRAEVANGRLPVMRIGAEERIAKSDLHQFLEMSKSQGHGQSGNHARHAMQATATAKGFDLKLASGKPFDYRWPDNTKEHHNEAYVGTVRTTQGVHSLTIGLTEREAAGKLRKRCTVFLDKRPMVEFVGADDFKNSGLLVSVIKKRAKQVSPLVGPPPEYSGFNVGPYNEYVKGPYASTNLAVICKKD